MNAFAFISFFACSIALSSALFLKAAVHKQYPEHGAPHHPEVPHNPIVPVPYVAPSHGYYAKYGLPVHDEAGHKSVPVTSFSANALFGPAGNFMGTKHNVPAPYAHGVYDEHEHEGLGMYGSRHYN